MKTNGKRILLDLVMILVVSTLYCKNVISLAYHEIMGIVLFVLFALHLIWNRNWIASVFAKHLNRTRSGRTKAMAFLDVLLAVFWGLVFISGILISKKLFSFHFSRNWIRMHFFFAAVALILTGVHLGMHRTYLANVCRNLFSFQKHLTKPAAMVIMVCLLAFGCYSTASMGMARWITAPFTQTQQYGSGENGAGGHREMTGTTVQETASSEGKTQQRKQGHFSMLKLLRLVLKTISILYLCTMITSWIDLRVRRIRK